MPLRLKPKRRFPACVPACLLALGVSLAIPLLFTALVPFHQDEFIHYRFIRCAEFPNLKIFPRDDCTGFWDLNFLNTGVLLPLRVYWYAGTIPALFYYPVYLLWASPVSARWLGVLFLLAQAGALSRLFRMRFVAVFAGLLAFFPYFFQHIVDTGPVGFQILSVYLFALLFRHWCRTRSWRDALLAGLLVFVGVWTKLVYLWLLPGIAVLFLFAAHEERGALRRRPARRTLLLQCVAAAAVAAALLSLIFFSGDPYEPGEFPYLAPLLRGEAVPLPEMLRTLWSLPAVRILLNPLESTHRIYEVAPAGMAAYAYDALLLLTLPAFVCMLLASGKRKLREPAVKAGILYALFLATFFLVARTREVWAMHHVVLAFPFLILSLFTLLGSWKELRHLRVAGVPLHRALQGAGAVFLALNLFFFLMFTWQPVQTLADRSRDNVHGILNDPYLARNYIYVSLENGLYFYQSLYGHKDQSITFRNPLFAQWQMDELLALREQTGRKLLFVFDSVALYSDYGLVHANVETVHCTAADPSWVWQIMLEPDGSPENICLR